MDGWTALLLSRSFIKEKTGSVRDRCGDKVKRRAR